MHTRPLLAGFIVGIALALSPSCGGTKACGPSTCTGCCDSSGDCQLGASNNACGQLGAACNVCQFGQSCSFGTCSGGIGQGGGSGGGNTGGGGGSMGGGGGTTGGGGGTTGGGGGTTGGGGGTTGGGGGTTGGGGGTTGGGGGTTGGGGGTTLQPIGGACTSASNCQAGLFCKQTTTRGDATMPGGYCTKACSTSTDCGGGAGCIGGASTALAFFGESTGFCAGSCPSAGAQSTCRTGYLCYGQTGAAGFCYLQTLPPFNGGGTPPAGAPCSSDTQCQNPPDPALGFCFPPTLSDGGASGWTDGYCSADCGLDNTGTFCGPNGACLTLGTAPNEFDACLQKCPGPGTRSTCRTGYTCEDIGNGGVCFPDCLAVGCPSGGTCDTGTGQCL
jgi:hypothetical protein